MPGALHPRKTRHDDARTGREGVAGCDSRRDVSGGRLFRPHADGRGAGCHARRADRVPEFGVRALIPRLRDCASWRVQRGRAYFALRPASQPTPTITSTTQNMAIAAISSMAIAP